jgi:hypothetical protein
MGNILKFIGGFVVLVLFGCVGLAVLGALAGGGSTASVSSGTAAGSNQTANLGEMTTVGDALWVVRSAAFHDNVSGNGFSVTAPSDSRFLVVEASVKNNGNEAASLLNPKVVDSQGREFETSSDFELVMALGSDRNCFIERVNPGTGKECSFVYMLPNDAQGLHFLARPFGFSTSTLRVNLAK